MRRVNQKKTPSVRPVEKIELEDKNNKRKLVFLILFLVIGIGAIGYGIYQAVSKPVGWTKIEANSASKETCSNEFVLLYHLGVSGVSATAENKAIVSVYTQAAEKAYQLFNSDLGFEGVNNIYYINQHPNEAIVVDKVLYEAFSLLQNYNNRNIYLGPVYMQYDDMFYCEDDSQTVDYDPILNTQVAEYYGQIAAFAGDAKSIELQLLGDNTVRLHVSQEYMDYAGENFITCFLDFFWMKNAFIIDYLAEVLIAHDYTLGAISSYDGFSRNLSESDMEFSLNIYNRNGQDIYQAATMQYSGAQSTVNLRNYMMNSLDIQHYYQFENGETRTSYLDVNDGIPKSAIDTMNVYSKEKGCAEILLEVIPIYISEALDEKAIAKLVDSGINTIYSKDFVIYYNDSYLILSDLYDMDGIHYSTKQIE